MTRTRVALMIGGAAVALGTMLRLRTLARRQLLLLQSHPVGPTFGSAPPSLFVQDPLVSGLGEAVDHERQHGVPPPSTDDYQELLDIEGASSFPASDPPSGW